MGEQHARLGPTFGGSGVQVGVPCRWAASWVSTWGHAPTDAMPCVVWVLDTDADQKGEGSPARARMGPLRTRHALGAPAEQVMAPSSWRPPTCGDGRPHRAPAAPMAWPE